YGEIVRVVTMGGESKELCGGTHVDNTAKIGSIRVTSEFSVASGVRRIEAVTGVEALEYARASQTELGGVLASLKAANAPEALKRIEQLTAENRELRRQAESFAAKAALGEADELLNNTADINGVKFAGTILPGGADTDELRRLGDALRDREPSIVAVFSAVSGDKLTFFAAVGKDAIAKGVKAGELVKRVSQFAGGSGGGKPDSAMGGGKDISKQADALGVAKQYVTEVTSK
ncbi:MAG: alanine--tRNA ligase, partial [Oscillospiraceae bacterium]|nr:alanine--tRNA ligase [Oscillospiraceae bacterium]